MKKVRISNFFMVFGLLCLVTLSPLLQETAEFIPVMGMILFCFACALYVESTITFRVLKVIDELKWVNDLGVGPAFVFLDILCLFGVIIGIISMLTDYNNMSMITSAYAFLILPLSSRSTCIYLGKHYIYIQNTFFRIKDVDSFTKNVVEQGKHIGETEFVINANHKTYKVKFKPHLSEGVNAFTSALENSHTTI